MGTRFFLRSFSTIKKVFHKRYPLQNGSFRDLSALEHQSAKVWICVVVLRVVVGCSAYTYALMRCCLFRRVCLCAACARV